MWSPVLVLFGVVESQSSRVCRPVPSRPVCPFLSLSVSDLASFLLSLFHSDSPDGKLISTVWQHTLWQTQTAADSTGASLPPGLLYSPPLHPLSSRPRLSPSSASTHTPWASGWGWSHPCFLSSLPPPGVRPGCCCCLSAAVLLAAWRCRCRDSSGWWVEDCVESRGGAYLLGLQRYGLWATAVACGPTALASLLCLPPFPRPCMYMVVFFCGTKKKEDIMVLYRKSAKRPGKEGVGGRFRWSLIWMGGKKHKVMAVQGRCNRLYLHMIHFSVRQCMERVNTPPHCKSRDILLQSNFFKASSYYRQHRTVVPKR